MAIKAGVGMSHHHNPSIAGREAAEQALEKVGVDKPDFVLMFGSSGYNQRSLLGPSVRLPEVQLLQVVRRRVR